MQYYYRLGTRGKWVGPYTEGRLCLFDAAWAAHLSKAPVEALAVPRSLNLEEALKSHQVIPAVVPTETLVSNIKHQMYEPPSDWIIAADEDTSRVADLQQLQRMKRGLNPHPRRTGHVQIRLATEEDIPLIIEIQRRAYAPYLSLFAPHQITEMYETVEDLRQAFQNMQTYVALIDTTIRGSARVTLRSGVAVMPSISVDPDVAGQGIGTALVESIEDLLYDQIHKIYTESPLLWHRATRFFMGMAYEPAAILRRHYNGLDWLMFEKFVG